MRLFARLTAAALVLTACGSPALPPSTESAALSVTVQPSSVQIGQQLSFDLKLTNTAEVWNVALFVENPEGEVMQLLPNRTLDGRSTLTGGAARVFPDSQANFVLRAGGRAGTHTVLAYATPKPLDLSSISAHGNEQDASATVDANRQGKGTLKGSLGAVLKLQHSGIAAFTTLTVTPEPMPTLSSPSLCTPPDK